MIAVFVSLFDTGPLYYLPAPPPGAIRGPYPPRFAPYPVNQGPAVLSPEKLDLRARVLKQIEYYFRQVMLPYIDFFCAFKLRSAHPLSCLWEFHILHSKSPSLLIIEWHLILL